MTDGDSKTYFHTPSPGSATKRVVDRFFLWHIPQIVEPTMSDSYLIVSFLWKQSSLTVLRTSPLCLLTLQCGQNELPIQPWKSSNKDGRGSYRSTAHGRLKGKASQNKPICQLNGKSGRVVQRWYHHFDISFTGVNFSQKNPWNISRTLLMLLLVVWQPWTKQKRLCYLKAVDGGL